MIKKTKLSNIEKVFKGRRPKTISKHRYYSILVPLIEKEDGIHILFEVRANSMSTQPGEVCFPGGQIEKEESIEEAAVRETYEEIGCKDIDILGRCDYLIGTAGFSLYGCVGVVKDIENIKLNSDEVEYTFSVPLSWFFDNEPEVHYLDIIQEPKADFPYETIKFENGYNFRKGIVNVPIYVYNEEVIWGMTAKIIRNVVEIISEQKMEINDEK